MKFVQPKKSRSSDTMVPLINVVFLLVIFFMLAGVLEAAPPFPIAAPETHQEKEPDQRKATIFLSADGQLALNGEVMAREEIVTSLKLLCAEQKKQDLQVMVEADGRASFQDLKNLTANLHNAGFDTVSLLAAAGAQQ